MEGYRGENHATAGLECKTRVSALGQWRKKRGLSFWKIKLAQGKDTKKNLRKKKQVKPAKTTDAIFKTAA